MAAHGKTNECPPKNRSPQKETIIVFQASIFRCENAVSFRCQVNPWICFLGGAFNGDEFIPWVPSNHQQKQIQEEDFSRQKAIQRNDKVILFCRLMFQAFSQWNRRIDNM